jgi:hypothetical protein
MLIVGTYLRLGIAVGKVKVYIQHYDCGLSGALIDCRHYKGDCRECSDHIKSWVEEREVTPDELIGLINNASDWYDVSVTKPED